MSPGHAQHAKSKTDRRLSPYLSIIVDDGQVLSAVNDINDYAGQLQVTACKGNAGKRSKIFPGT